MAGTIVAITALAYWDAQREALGSLRDFAAEQSTLAKSVAIVVRAHASSLGASALPEKAGALLADVNAVEEPGSVRLFVSRPGQTGLASADGLVTRNETVEHGLLHGDTWVRLSREDAERLSLPRRTAIAGLSTFEGPGGRWGIVVATTARRERDRELRDEQRPIFGVVLASTLVLAFGGLALRNQRKELELERELSLAELSRERDAHLLQIDKLATLGALATGIAHEVSTPLGVIVGRAEQLLPKMADDERARKGVEAILEQGRRIDGVVRGFLDLVRGHAPAIEDADPAAVAHAAAQLVEHRFASAGVRLDISADPGLLVIGGNPRLVEQALVNLLLNACDACDAGGAVELRTRADGGRVAFTVTDDGCGITDENRARVLEPFFTTKPVGKGTGLGLSIASEIAKNHDGELTIGARPDGARGTRACLLLPFKAKESPVA